MRAENAAAALEVMSRFAIDPRWLVYLPPHGIFQAYHYAHKVGGDRHALARERYRGHPHFDVTARFCAAWDMPAFDPDYDTLPLDDFLPAVRAVFSREPAGWGAA